MGGPAKWKQTVYAGFDLDQASLRTMSVDPRRDRFRDVFHGLWRFHAAGDKNSAARFTQRLSAQIFRGTSFFGTFPARNVKD
jgi:hypothetical protein